MYAKMVEKLQRALQAVGLQEPPVETGMVIDTLSRERFPARPDIGASLDVDTSTFSTAISMGPGHLPMEPTWRLRIKRPDGSDSTYSISDEIRNRLLVELRDQVARHGRVTEVPLPRLSGWTNG